VPFFQTGPAWLERLCDGTSTCAVFLGELALTATVLLVPAVLMGMSFPLLATPLLGESGLLGRWVGKVYAVNTLSGVVCALLTGFAFMPGVGMRLTIEILVAGSLFAGVIAWCCAARPRLLLRVPAGALCVLAIIAFWSQLPAGGFLKAPVREPRRL